MVAGGVQHPAVPRVGADQLTRLVAVEKLRRRAVTPPRLAPLLAEPDPARGTGRLEPAALLGLAGDALLLDEIQGGFNRHDVDAILSHFNDDCEWLMASGPTMPEGRRCVGKPEIGDVLAGCYDQIPDMRWEDIRHWAVADQTRAISEWTVRGTRNGVTFEYLGCDFWEFHNGYVTKKDSYWRFES